MKLKQYKYRIKAQKRNDSTILFAGLRGGLDAVAVPQNSTFLKKVLQASFPYPVPFQHLVYFLETGKKVLKYCARKRQFRVQEMK